MSVDKKLNGYELNKLVLAVLEIPLAASLFEKFSIGQLEAVSSFYVAKRQTLIESKEVERNGLEIEKINGELSAVKVEMVKINKAIAEHKKKPKKTHQVNKVDQIVKSLNQSDEEFKLIQAVSACRSIPDITDNFNLDQIQYAKEYFKQHRKSIIDENKEKSEKLSPNDFNITLRIINNQIDKMTKAFLFLQQQVAKDKRKEIENKPKALENDFNFLKNFFITASEQLDEQTFNRFKIVAEESVQNKA